VSFTARCFFTFFLLNFLPLLGLNLPPLSRDPHRPLTFFFPLTCDSLRTSRSPDPPPPYSPSRSSTPLLLQPSRPRRFSPLLVFFRATRLLPLLLTPPRLQSLLFSSPFPPRFPTVSLAMAQGRAALFSFFFGIDVVTLRGFTGDRFPLFFRIPQTFNRPHTFRYLKVRALVFSFFCFAFHGPDVFFFRAWKAIPPKDLLFFFPLIRWCVSLLRSATAPAFFT